jgi:Cytidine and deoxycytidylate deaminase zinc-binding region
MNNAQARPPLLVGHLPVRGRDLLLAPVAAGFAAGVVQAGDSASLPSAVEAVLEPAMREAIAQARLARYQFGAALIDVETGATLFRAHNTTQDGDPSAHAEVNAMRGAGLAGIELSRTVLVTSAESCPMCASAPSGPGSRGSPSARRSRR